MAAPGLFTVLSNIPWGPVLDAAPKVADGATRLWDAVRRRKDVPGAPTATDADGRPPAPAIDPLAEVHARIDALQTTADHLADEMRAASELIKQLAEQNAALVQRVELNRRRLVRLSAVGGGVVAALLVALLVLLFRSP